MRVWVRLRLRHSRDTCPFVRSVSAEPMLPAAADYRSPTLDELIGVGDIGVDNVAGALLHPKASESPPPTGHVYHAACRARGRKAGPVLESLPVGLEGAGATSWSRWRISMPRCR